MSSVASIDIRNFIKDLKTCSHEELGREISFIYELWKDQIEHEKTKYNRKCEYKKNGKKCSNDASYKNTCKYYCSEHIDEKYKHNYSQWKTDHKFDTEEEESSDEEDFLEQYEGEEGHKKLVELLTETAKEHNILDSDNE